MFIFPFFSLYSHQSHESRSEADQRRHRYNDQRELPAPREAQKKTAHKCGKPLDENPHLIGDGIIYLVDVTVVKIM